MVQILQDSQQEHCQSQYSLMPDIFSIIKSRNKKILSRSEVKSLKKSCNRREKTYFSINGDCLQAIVIQYLPSMNKSTIAFTPISQRVLLNTDFMSIKAPLKQKNKRNSTELFKKKSTGILLD